MIFSCPTFVLCISSVKNDFWKETGLMGRLELQRCGEVGMLPVQSLIIIYLALALALTSLIISVSGTSVL